MYSVTTFQPPSQELKHHVDIHSLTAITAAFRSVGFGIPGSAEGYIIALPDAHEPLEYESLHMSMDRAKSGSLPLFRQHFHRSISLRLDVLGVKGLMSGVCHRGYESRAPTLTVE